MVGFYLIMDYEGKNKNLPKDNIIFLCFLSEWTPVVTGFTAQLYWPEVIITIVTDISNRAC